VTAAPAAARLTTGFLRSSELFPGHPALEVGDETLTYDALRRRATSIATALMTWESRSAPPLTAVLTSRHWVAFAGVLGALLRGHGYVPLNPRFPARRNRLMLERAGCRSVVVDAASLDAVADILATVDESFLVVAPDGDAREVERRRWGRHSVIGSRELDESVSLAHVAPDDPAYLLFTSGSTGNPKGVLVTHANVRAFLNAIGDRYSFTARDRFSQMFDLTFDLSAFDMFVAWECGACVCCPDAKQLLKPSDFIRDAHLTVWFSVPSVAMFLQRLGSLKPGAFPMLRLSLFCGEGLPADVATEWAAAAPASLVDNLYGPTEATIACTAHRWDDRSTDVHGLVPIGRPLEATRVRVVDESLHDVPIGTPGELLLSGPQVVAGYWRDPTTTARSFVSHPELGHSYLTGDRVVEAHDGTLAYLGRLDSQIKVLGHRVELGEVEAVLREEASADAVAVGWPPTASGAAGIVAFVANPSVDRTLLRQRLAARLPDYMIPREIRTLTELPLNANGKRDRRALLELLGAG
jgi:amino acid adenylation domain-containing protein